MISSLYQFSLLFALVGALLNQFATWQIAVGALIIVVILAVVQHWALRQLNADPADDLDNSSSDKDAEVLGNVPVRSKVGTPRARRLQPLRSDEAAFSESETFVPADSLAMAGSAALSKPLGSSLLGEPAMAGVEMAAKATPVEGKAAETIKGPMLPPFGSTDVAAIGTPVTPPPADKAGVSEALPPLSVIPPLVTAGVKPTDSKDAPVPPALIIPATLPVTAAETDDDVKKRKTPPTAPTAEPSRPGFTIVPKSEDAPVAATPAAITSPVPTPEIVKIPETPAAKITSSIPSPDGKAGGRPRIFLPASLPITPEKPVESTAADLKKPADSPVVIPAEVKVPSPEIPAKVESKEETPAAVSALEVKPESKPAAKVEIEPEPKVEPKPEAKVEPKPEPAVEIKPEAKEDTQPEPESKLKVEAESEPVVTSEPVPAPDLAPPEPVKPETQSTGGWLRGILRRSDSEEASKPESSAPAAKPEIAPAPSAVPLAEVKPPVAEEKPPAEPTLAAATPSVPVPALPVSVVPTPGRAAPASIPQPTMAQTESTTNVPATSRASAQLTLGFEIASLQLTPFFKLGAVQLKPLSNVVGLHLIASQTAENPLAAGISFQIDKVELNAASHISAITLKPLAEAQAAAVPQSKLQVDAVQIGQGGDGAPISVTSGASSAVQLLATFAIAAMEFTPAFEIGFLRLEPTSNSVLLRLAPSSRPAALDLPPSFEVANVQLGENAQISGMRLTPGGKPA